MDLQGWDPGDQWLLRGNWKVLRYNQKADLHPYDVFFGGWKLKGVDSRTDLWSLGKFHPIRRGESKGSSISFRLREFPSRILQSRDLALIKARSQVLSGSRFKGRRMDIIGSALQGKWRHMRRSWLFRISRRWDSGAGGTVWWGLVDWQRVYQGNEKELLLFLQENKRELLLFCFLAHRDFEFVQKFQSHFGYDSLVTVDPNGRSGGLALFYNNEYQVKILYSSNRMIDIEAVSNGKQVFLTFVYGDPVQELREHVWERLTRYGLARSDPWFIISDLNEITGNHEKDGGPLRSATSFIPFNNMIRNSGLLEFPARGNKMSWQGRRGKGKGAFTVRCRLDRALANEEWHTLFPYSYTEYLRLVGSDHRPVVAFLEDKLTRRRRGQFRFDKRWIGQEGLMESIVSGWTENQEGSSADFITKINNCRHEISSWRKNNQPYGKDKIQDLQKALEEVQTDDNRTQEDIIDISKKLQEAYKDEEEYWHQKSRNMWHSSGDLNTKFYHALTKQRRIRNKIVGLYDEAGNWVTEENGVEKVAVDYFDGLFSSTNPGEFDSFLEEIGPSISPQMNLMLLRVATEEEVRQALFMMHPEKAPGPDGMTALFFKHSWNVIKKDVVELANKEECQTILRILKEYETVSGQQINFQKSSIQFGYKIEESNRQELRDILGIQNLGGMGSYLGLPESLGGSKVQVFGFVQDRMNNRVNGWTLRFFTKGGKEVIIKSGITALPNHVMSVYRLPKAIVKKLTSAVAQFWWSPGGSTRGMHWKSWDKLCAHKDNGGLGFKDLTDFNTAMLGKQLWRLIEKPNSLFSRIFKGRVIYLSME
ncbi:uncharacterized protein LOC125607235 [Brassica napus]|uniref:uncharacterized protein LOC125607235 n=1 Tax=Brassica napus TaxID=3708 RepID=UPI0020787A4D|nr:uncharacterized protein LOC125607235 [Brassica napus]